MSTDGIIHTQSKGHTPTADLLYHEGDPGNSKAHILVVITLSETSETQKDKSL